VTSSPSDTETAEVPAADPLAEYAAGVATAVGAIGHSSDFRTVKVQVATTDWVETITTARDELGLIFFSYLSAIDWSNEVSVGDPPADTVDERYEVLCGLADITEGKMVHFSTSLAKGEASLPTITGVFPGAGWHEREAAEMFGITFEGHPNPGPLYLPDGFQGNPLQKSYPLLSREVKPWPGKVDVEDMPEKDEAPDADAPSTENPEA